MLIGLNDRVLLEQAYRQVSIDYLISEDIVGNTGFVYHRTAADPTTSAIWEQGVDNTKNKRGMYGKGLYCTYRLDSQLDPEMLRTYGKYIIRGKIDLSDFFIFDKFLFIKSKPGQNYLDQYKKHNLLTNKVNNQRSTYRFFPYDKIKEGLKEQERDPDNYYSSDLAHICFRKLIQADRVSGLAFRGRQDGYVAVVYERRAFIPQAYSEDDGKTWIPIKPNIANILKPVPGSFANNINNYYIRSSVPRQTFRRILAEYNQNKKLTINSIRSFLKYCITLNTYKGEVLKRLTENQYEIFKDGSVNIATDTCISFDDIVTTLPVKFNFIRCNMFYAPYNTNSLKNLPNRIKGSMTVLSKGINSLNGCPAEIYGDFNLKGLSITTLEGGPSYVAGKYTCSELSLQSLNGLPRYIGKRLEIDNCPKLKDVTALFKANIGQRIDKDYSYGKYPVSMFVNGRGTHHSINYDTIELLQQKGLIAPRESDS